jgi:preprotein translocase subunit Sec61beta
MSKKPQVQMPQSTAGLIRYFEESNEAIKLKPEHVVAICVIMIGAILAMRFLV